MSDIALSVSHPFAVEMVIGIMAASLQVIEVNFGGRATNDAHYANKRSKMWDSMAKWLTSGGSLPNHMELKTDLCVPTYKFDAANKLVLESKDKIKERGMRSPDLADGLCLTFAMPVAPTSTFIGRPDSEHQYEYNPFQYPDLGDPRRGDR